MACVAAMSVRSCRGEAFPAPAECGESHRSDNKNDEKESPCHQRLARLAVAIAPCAAVAADSLPKSPRPAYPHFLDKYPALADSSRYSDLLDSDRYFRLGEASSLTLGGELRYRADSVTNPAFGLRGVHRDSYLQQRALVHADLHLFDDALRAFVQLANTESWDKAVFSPYDESRNEVHQAFVDVRLPAREGSQLIGRIGRQELSYGNQTMIATRAIPNVRQTFDGGLLKYSNASGYKLDVFAVKPVVNVREQSFNDSSSGAGGFYGAYATLPLGREVKDDVYAYSRQRDSATLDGFTGEEDRHTLGNRLHGNVAEVDLTWDLMYQFGQLADADIRAWATSATVGHAYRDLKWQPALALHFNAASSDDDPHDNKSNTFDPLFPANGKFFGEASLTTLANLVSAGPQFVIAPRSDFTVSTTLLGMWRQTENGAVYLPGMQPLAGTSAAGGDFMGTTVDLFARWAATENLTVDLEYLYFDVSGPIRSVGGSNSQFVSLRTSLMF